ncbi:phage holin family protein [Allorhodopirellula heiligendammensis]|uniref:Phage holin family protein n=1 Tax=Allorhodopirellula heiligendammensis TaxID=2714739 RepID=A0A5C6BWJ7_9BACT|nr:phage holin family protein [Allorhodopirellula heiligendammensis]TWU16202.1 hypothetical protein Poly21_34070 [Allorhodopirellula heiligendammensis]|tara:strand:- start:1284 stop:1802 length:519 start_codon:yes stop_codon:yes gene_type:complete
MSSSANTEPSLSSFQRVIRDVLDLFELQMELISVDSQAAKRKLVQAAVCGSIALALAGSALTVAMVGAGVLLGESTQLTTGAAMLIVSLVFFAIVALLGWVALRAILAASAAMSETKSEFGENLRWLKATLISPQTSARNQFRRESFYDRTSVSYSDTVDNDDPASRPLYRR